MNFFIVVKNHFYTSLLNFLGKINKDITLRGVTVNRRKKCGVVVVVTWMEKKKIHFYVLFFIFAPLKFHPG